MAKANHWIRSSADSADPKAKRRAQAIRSTPNSAIDAAGVTYDVIIQRIGGRRRQKRQNVTLTVPHGQDAEEFVADYMREHCPGWTVVRSLGAG